MAEDGIIPAYAGLTVVAFCVSEGDGDHPRLRGVNNDFGIFGEVPTGIIPAYAGLTTGLLAYC